jgi:hypothetical protein
MLNKLIAMLMAFTMAATVKDMMLIQQLEKATGVQTNATTIDEALRVYAMRSTGR